MTNKPTKTEANGQVSWHVMTEPLKATHCPIILTYSGWPNTRRDWTLKFQQAPTMDILLDGDYPSRDEIIECLFHAQAPIWMIGVCEVAAAVARRNMDEKKDAASND